MARVSDYSALLYYLDGDHFRWNSPMEVGTQAVVTYRFLDESQLGDPSNDPTGATSYWTFTDAHQDLFREVAAKYEAISGIRFVEVDGPAMINAFGFDGGEAGGYANIAMSDHGVTINGSFAIGTADMDVGTYGYVTLLHELGHALGLQHPHDGSLTLVPQSDIPEHTVMTYNHAPNYVTELGTFDIQAMQHLYGTADSFGTALEGNEWEILGGQGSPIIIRANAEDNTIIGTNEATTINGKEGHDHIQGREANDILRGSQGRDTVVGGLGDDRLFGGNGHDTLIGGLIDDGYSGGPDSDRLFGERGNDLLAGGAGTDLLSGGRGRDTLIGGDGADTLTGGMGADTFVFDFADIGETDQITDFGRGADVIDLSGLWIGGLDQVGISIDNADTILSLTNTFELRLAGFSESLDASDFIFG
ncbi:metallopeptidase [Phaeobacter sp.]|uniref:M10 family metallopeptidase C-terminal domain-containing protein n=1 Tax=Phaeobacter sp. TaxID=1902409 RepID=UPI0025F55E53|nr:metallopeptidase [Phaeobacter sp.]